MKTRNYAWLTAIMLIAGLLGWAASGMAGISNTKHNLSVSGPVTNTYKATSETQICVFCHTPHNTNPAAPLWNHTLSTQTYTPYSSLTLKAAAPGQPTGTSKLCLSCHDGTVALGGVQNLPLGHQTAGTITGLAAVLLGTDAANLGTDLRNDHPVSFTYDAALATANPELVLPAALTGKIKPDSTGQLQCSSCHDPHSETYPKFLHVGYTDGAGYGSPLCLTCHNKRYWGTLDRVANATHREATIKWNGVGTNPWHVPGHNIANDPVNSTNKANGCESCHQPHNAATSGSRILKQDGEAGVCLVCHNGNVVTDPAKNIDAAMNKAYVHPSKDPAYDGRHSPKRQADGKVREDQANLAVRHAECEDCHNPHAVSPGVSSSSSNLAAAVNKGVWGVEPTNYRTNALAAWTAAAQSGGYTISDDVTYQYQICLKCHSSYAFGATPPADPYGHIAGGINTDQAKEFNPSNASYHPVVVAGKNPFNNTNSGNYAASLINGMTPTTVFTCSECHSDSDPAASGLKGPHGSNVWPIIWGPYDRTTGMAATSNHLCFKCHDYNVYAGTTDYVGTINKTGFRGTVGGAAKNLHARHVNMRDMPCLACHAGVPHGMPQRALLVYGRGASKTPQPYNAHSQVPIYGTAPACHNTLYTDCTDYGINSNVTNVNAIVSGTWKKTDCHTGSGTGACATGSTYP